MMLAIRGTFIHCTCAPPSLDSGGTAELEVLEDTLIVVNAPPPHGNGAIAHVARGAAAADALTRRLGLRDDGNGDGADGAADSGGDRGEGADKTNDAAAPRVRRMRPSEFALPGFIDLHVHAPQAPYAGTATDRPLMGADGWLEQCVRGCSFVRAIPLLRSSSDCVLIPLLRPAGTTWRCPAPTLRGMRASFPLHLSPSHTIALTIALALSLSRSRYTFPAERAMRDTALAARVYDTVVTRLLRHGTTTAVYFGSIHAAATRALADACATRGQRAIVGKVRACWFSYLMTIDFSSEQHDEARARDGANSPPPFSSHSISRARAAALAEP